VKVSDQLLESIDRVPPLPVAASRLIELQGDPDRSIGMVGKVVSLDAGLTAAVLRSANSAAAHPAQPIVSVLQAVSYLGERAVLALALSICTPRFLDPLQGYEAERGALWRHSFRTAAVARALIAHCRRPPAADLAFTAGLLHDIGRTVLAAHLKGKALSMVREVLEKRCRDFVDAEREVLGVSHCDVGAELARRWKLPGPLEAAIGFHHQPSQAPETFASIAYVVHAADLIAMMGGDDAGIDAFTYHLDPGLPQHLDINRRVIEGLMLTVECEMRQAALILGKREDS
jgi:putative nucleotidyltransferase with HDIG domain